MFAEPVWGKNWGGCPVPFELCRLTVTPGNFCVFHIMMSQHGSRPSVSNKYSHSLLSDKYLHNQLDTLRIKTPSLPAEHCRKLVKSNNRFARAGFMFVSLSAQDIACCLFVFFLSFIALSDMPFTASHTLSSSWILGSAEVENTVNHPCYSFVFISIKICIFQSGT